MTRLHVNLVTEGSRTAEFAAVRRRKQLFNGYGKYVASLYPTG
jgi:hypothetical protein